MLLRRSSRETATIAGEAYRGALYILPFEVLHHVLFHTVTTEELLTCFPPDSLNQQVNQYSRAESMPEACMERVRFMENFVSCDGITLFYDM